jgi:hypothetical protein
VNGGQQIDRRLQARAGRHVLTAFDCSIARSVIRMSRARKPLKYPSFPCVNGDFTHAAGKYALPVLPEEASMRFSAVLALLVSLLMALPTVSARADMNTFTVGVVDGSTGQPVAGVKVEIKDLQGNTLGEGVTGANGEAEIPFEIPEGDGPVLIDTDAKDAAGRRAFYVSPYPRSGGVQFQTTTHGATGPDLTDLISAAIAKCDKAAYDRWVAELRSLVDELQRQLDQARQAADGHARAKGLRTTDKRGAEKDLRRASKAQEMLPPEDRNPQALSDIMTYIDLLEEIERLEAALGAAQDALEALPPFPEDCKEKKTGFLPGNSNCPESSTGALAGALNEAFETDVESACPESSTQRDKKRDRPQGNSNNNNRD